MSISREKTIEALIITLLQAETAAQTFYLRLMEAFAHEPDAARVWWMLGADEASHIRLLEQTLGSLAPERRLSLADPLILENARNVARFSPERTMASIATLEDAYQIAHALENSELNAIFEFVLTEYFPKPLQWEFVHNMLRVHVDRLNELRTTEWRRSIPIHSPQSPVPSP